MKWIAYREGSSASAGTWDYMQVPDYCKNARDVEEYMDDRNMLSNWSEHYRGIEVTFVRKVPQRVIDEGLKDARMRLTQAQEDIKVFEVMTPGKVDLRLQQRKRDRRKRNKIYRDRGLHHLIRED